MENFYLYPVRFWHPKPRGTISTFNFCGMQVCFDANLLIFLLAVMRLYKKKKRGLCFPLADCITILFEYQQLTNLNKTVFFLISTFLSADWKLNLSEYKHVSLMILWILCRLSMTQSWFNTRSFWVCSGLVMTLRRFLAKALMWVTNTGNSWRPLSNSLCVTSYRFFAYK